MNVNTTKLYSGMVKDLVVVAEMDQSSIIIVAKVARCQFLLTDQDLNHWHLKQGSMVILHQKNL
jgi:hypothetical protein